MTKNYKVAIAIARILPVLPASLTNTVALRIRSGKFTLRLVAERPVSTALYFDRVHEIIIKTVFWLMVR